MAAAVVVLAGLVAYGSFSVLGRSGEWAARHPPPTTPPGGSPTTSPPTSSAAPSTETTPSPATTIGSYAIGTVSMTVPGPSTEQTTIPVTIWFPAEHGPSGLVPDSAGGPYPMIAFSQGYEVTVSQYAGLLSAWASAGFVVAAPTYPHTAPTDPGDLDEGDIVNHPADLRTVISSLLADSSHPGSLLSGLIDGRAIGLAGHSDGGDVSLATADNTCCRYPGVKAVAVLSGAELTSFGGEYFASPSPPILVVQGDDDTVNAPACSAQIYDDAPAPKYYLDLLGAGHYTPYVTAGAYEAVVAKVTTGFFAAELYGKPTALSSVSATADVPNVANLIVGGTAPPATGTCPGAP